MAKGNWKHGLCSRVGRNPLFQTWCEMRYRCENPEKWQYKYYGGRGIAVCERWSKFENFVSDMGNRPEGTTLDRIDSNGNYSPENCRWATKKQQANNSRNNRRITVRGESMTVAEASDRYGVKAQTIYARLDVYGWREDAAALTPSRPWTKRNERAQRA